VANKGKHDQSRSETKVTRIKATDSGRKPKLASVVNGVPVIKPAQKTTTTVKKDEQHDIWVVRAAKAFGGYFKGAWTELRNVRWPNRQATWSLTGAVLAFCAFFVIIILLLDALFKYVFELIIK